MEIIEGNSKCLQSMECMQAGEQFQKHLLNVWYRWLMMIRWSKASKIELKDMKAVIQ